MSDDWRAIDRQWRALDEWGKARYRWMVETVLHPDVDADGQAWPVRENQLTPDGDWLVALWLAGRGFGKTRCGAEDFSEYARNHADHRLGVIADTFQAFRDICVEGESGLLSILPPSALAGGAVQTAWNRSLAELRFSNGTWLKGFTAEKPEQTRGYQFHRLWCEELGKWPYPQATWDMAQMALRLGEHPQTIVTTTPKPIGLLIDLATRPTTVVIRGSSFDNARNLPASQLAEWEARYGGTQLGRQELYGELIADFEGALWRREWIDDTRVAQAPDLVRIAVGIDPSTWSPEGETGHVGVGRGVETGIVVAGVDALDHVYVLADLSCRESPLGWSRRAVNAYRSWGANAIVPETNVGDWVLAQIGSAAEGGERPVIARGSTGRPGIRVSEGKRTRAEPVSTWYEKGMVHHVGAHPELENQLTGWDPRENWSPDRLDALVHAVTWLEPWKPHRPAESTLDEYRAAAPLPIRPVFR